MREKGFGQLPVLAPGGKKLVGLVTLGNILSRLTHGRASGRSPVSEAMFNFLKLPEVITDPRDIGPVVDQPREKGRRFVEITLDTPLSVLNRFFEWNSAAVITERDTDGFMKPVAVATKVDLLTWMLYQNK
jgi:cystathionine beta-synthase